MWKIIKLLTNIAKLSNVAFSNLYSIINEGLTVQGGNTLTTQRHELYSLKLAEFVLTIHVT